MASRGSQRITTVLVVLMLVEAAGLVLTTANCSTKCFESVGEVIPAEPRATVELADVTQTISFTLDAYSYEIVQFDYQASHLNQHVSYQLSFSVPGGWVEFFICPASDAAIWAAGGSILISTSDHWGSTNGLTITRGIQSNVAYAFVFNHDGSGSRTITGSIVVDTTPPSVVTSLVDNKTYSGDVVITASATDVLAGVHEIALFIDEEKVFSAPDDIDFLWRTGSYSDGNHTVVVFANDEDYNYVFLFFTVWVSNHPAISLSAEVVGLLLLGVVGLVAVLGGYFYLHWKRTRMRLAPQAAIEL